MSARQRWAAILAGARANLPGTLAVGVEVVLVALLLWSVFAFRDATSRRGESRETVATIDRTLIAVVEAEGGQRGYLLTGDLSYLASYEEALDRLDVAMADLERRLAGQQREAYERLVPLVEELRASLDSAAEARRAGATDDAYIASTTARSRDLMGRVRSELDMLHDIETRRLEERIDRANQLGSMIAAISVTGALVTLAIVAWLFVALRRRQEADTLRAVAAAKDEFVGFVSHELRTPMAVISGNARLLAGGTQLGEEERDEALSEIVAATERLQDIVDTLLSLSRAESGAALEVEPILLHRIAQSVRRHHRARYPEREVEVRVAEDVRPALGDRGAVEQVLLNLMSNAEKYGARGTPIVVTVECNAEEARVSVDNQGEILSSHELEHVFEPFFRGPASAAARPGVGLGLTICHRLVAAQGGRMIAEALPAGGARFSFHLPLAPLQEE